MAWTPGTATASIFACLILNAIIGTVFYILFELFRNYNVEVYAPRLRTSKSLVIAKPSAAVFGWFKQVWEVNDSDLLRMIGLDGYVFLRYLRMSAKIAGICMFGLLIMLPSYYTAAGNEKVWGINLLTMANIPEDGNRLWVCLLFAYVFSFVFLYLIYKEYEHFAECRMEYFKHGGEGASLASLLLAVDRRPQGRGEPEEPALSPLHQAGPPGVRGIQSSGGSIPGGNSTTSGIAASASVTPPW